MTYIFIPSTSDLRDAGFVFTTEQHTSPPSQSKTPFVVRSGANVAKLV
jgi:hypothetical protein